MASSVTLPGANGVVTVQSGTGDNTFIAQIIANNILLALPQQPSVSGGNPVTNGYVTPPVTVSINGGAPTTAPAPTAPAGENILYLVGDGGGSFVIPTGYNYVIDLLTGSETISGSNVQLISADSASSAFNLTGNSSVAADPASDNDAVTLSGSFNVATGNGNDTVTAIGTGTVAGGTGTNIFNIQASVGSAGIRLQSNGQGDTVNIVTGSSVTVLSSGNDLHLTQNGIVTVVGTFSGTDDDLQGGAGFMNVSLGGSAAQVTGGTGPLFVIDDGSHDTIAALGSSGASVAATGSDGLIFGGQNTLDVTLSGAGGDTVVGANGGSTIASSATGDLILGATGSLTVNDGGTSDTIGSFNAASVTATLGGANDLLFGTSAGDPLAVTVTGTGDTVAAGAGSATIDANNGAAVFGGSGPLSFVGGSGTSTVLGATGGSENMTVGSGGAVFFTGSNNNSTIFGGFGQTTILGGSGSNVVFSSLSGGVGFQYLAGTGNESLDAAGSSTNNVLSFFEANGPLNDTVSGWTANDSLFLQGYSTATSSMSQSGSNVVFNLSNGSTVTFTDVQTGDFTDKVLYTGGTG